MTIQGGDGQHYHCLECDNILTNSEELLQHQEMHMREAGMEVELHEVCEVLEAEDGQSEVKASQPVQYQCLDCLALFDSPEAWLEHRRTHSRSSTHSNTETTEFVLQADGSVTPLTNVQNYLLSEQQAGEILAQVLAQQQQQKKRSSPSKPASSSRSALLPPVTALPGSATMHLQILTAQALADGPNAPGQRRSKLPTLLPAVGRSASNKLGVMENGVQRMELRLAPGIQLENQQQQTEVVVFHPYECSECSLLFQTPEDFLQHQGEHFLAQDKERADPGMMTGPEELRGREGSSQRAEDGRMKVTAEKKDGVWGKAQQCNLCSRTFTSANRLASHRRVHEQGTHECPECWKMFKKATSLQTHMRSHSGVARYLCVDCGNSFTNEMALITHRKQHTPEPLHICKSCNRTFSNMTKYLYHRRTHFNNDASSPALTPGLSNPRRASASALAILQRMREKRKQATASLLAPLTTKEMETVNSQSRPRGDQEGGGKLEVTAVTVGTPEVSQQDVGPGARVSLAPADSSGSSASAPSALVSCRFCSKTFPSQLQLGHHRQKYHASERRFLCGICGKAFKKQMHVRNHIRTHTGEKPFQCTDCGKTFSSLANLMRHHLVHSGLRPFRCDVCHRSFSQSSNLRQHSLLHSNAPKLTCPDCPASFRGYNKLAAHRYTHHQGAAPFPCPHCEAGFLTRRQRDAHCLQQHPPGVQCKEEAGEDAATPSEAEPALGSEPSTSSAAAGTQPLVKGGLDCGICGKKLNSAANLRLHRLSHFSLRPRGSTGKRSKAHQCLICGKLFVSASSVTLHQRVHTGERPFPCQVCGKRFRQNTHLREHLRIHSGERPFRCEICGKSFIQSMHLAEHRRTHTGERPHPCSLCGKAFKTFSNLRNHKKMHDRQQEQQQQQQEQAAVAAQAAADNNSTLAVVDTAATATLELTNGQQRVIQIQTSGLQQGTPTIMCNEFGETIAIIETSEGAALPLEQALEIYHTALENGLAMDGLQLI